MIDLIFNTLNLLVFLFLLSYAFYRYLLPSFKVAFHKYQSSLIELEQKKDELINAQLAVTLKNIEQEKLCIILKNKIDLWKQSIENSLLIKKNNAALLRDKLEEKLAKQSKNYQYEQLKKNIMPEVIRSVREDLEKHYDKPENRELYFANIFKELNKE